MSKDYKQCTFPNVAYEYMLPTNTFQYQSRAQSSEFNCGTHYAQRQCYIIERESLHTNSLKICTITKKMWWTGRSNFIYFLIEQSKYYVSFKTVNKKVKTYSHKHETGIKRLYQLRCSYNVVQTFCSATWWIQVSTEGSNYICIRR